MRRDCSEYWRSLCWGRTKRKEKSPITMEEDNEERGERLTYHTREVEVEHTENKIIVYVLRSYHEQAISVSVDEPMFVNHIGSNLSQLSSNFGKWEHYCHIKSRHEKSLSPLRSHTSFCRRCMFCCNHVLKLFECFTTSSSNTVSLPETRISLFHDQQNIFTIQTRQQSCPPKNRRKRNNLQ